MRQLLKVIIAIVAIIVLQLTKTLLSKDSAAYYFWYNLLSNSQLFLLILVVLLMVFERILFAKVNASRSTIASLILSLLLFSVAEIGCTYLLYHPQHIPGKLEPYFISYYDEFDDSGFQWEPGVCHYDTLLFYAMNPGRRFIFSNREYSDSFYINNNGFRSDSMDSRSPEIICLGDSHTLGLGVKQDQTFASLLSKSTGLKVLNTANSSYGTVRESLALRLLDTSAAKYILWQYCFNDAEENKSFVEKEFKYTPPPKKSFEYARALNSWKISYYPGKHFLTMLKSLASGIFKSKKNPVSPFVEIDSREQAINFLRIAERSLVNVSHAKVIVFDLGYQEHSDFIKSLKTLLAEKSFTELSKKIWPVDLAPFLRKENYYRLDPHLNAKGQMIVANELKKILMSIPAESR